MLLTLCFADGPLWKNQIARAQTTAQTIDRIAVGLKTNAPPHAAKRMASSIEAVGQQILLGRSLAEVAQNKNSYERLIKEIFDKVLVGYSVSKVAVTPLPTTRIDVEITPWNDVVESVAVEIDFGVLPQPVIEIIKEDIGNIESLVNETLVGLPVEAADWAGVIVKNSLREYLADSLPEFRPAFDITAGQRTALKIILTPNSPTVQDINVVVTSRTIPNILLTGLKPNVEETTALMLNLPVAFIQRHQDYFSRSLKSNADNYHLIKKYGLSTELSLSLGSVSEVKIKAETVKYKINIEGHLDIRRDKSEDNDNISVRLHFGRMFGRNNNRELFVETIFFPSSVKTHFEPGFLMAFTKKSVFDFRYNLSEKYAKIRFNQEISPKFTLRFERTPAIDYNEFGISYKVHEMLSVEYVFSNEENWLKLISRM